MDRSAAVARLLIAAEVSERDEAFVRTIAGPEAEEWWYGDDEQNLTIYGDVLALITDRIGEVGMDFLCLKICG